ncbi:type IV toxin-antitoxin system AbiEi family antitoxin domain-containing protein [soil metagenome]
MRLPAENSIAHHASAHHGVVHRKELLAEGRSERTVRRRAADGSLLRVAPEVYRIAGAPSTWHQRVVTACLTEGDPALASHRTAAALWGLDGFQPGIVEVTTPRWLRRRRPGVRVHESTDLADGDRVERSAIPVTSIERTLIDLGAVVHRHKVEQALDDALQRRLTTPEQVRDRFVQLARRGRRGVGVLRPLLERRLGTSGLRPSEFGRRVARLLEGAGLAPPELEHVVHDAAGVFVAQVDLAYVLAQVAIECDGDQWHSGRQRRQGDLDRQNRLVLAGWTILRFTWEDLVQRPHMIVARVRAALAAAS